MIWPIWPSAAAKPKRSLPSGSSWRKRMAPCSSSEKPKAALRSERARVGKRCGGGGLVIPDVRAVAEAAAAMIVGAFEAVEFAVGGAEASLGDEGGEVGRWRRRCTAGGMVLSRMAAAKRRVVLSRSGSLAAAYSAASQAPAKRVAVMIADDGVLFALGRGPAATRRACDWGSARPAGRCKRLRRRARSPVAGTASRWVCGCGASGPSRPSAEKSSQKSSGLVHHLASIQPRR